MAKTLFVGLFVLAYAVAALGQSKPSIQGAWQITETVFSGGGAAIPATVNAEPQPGLSIFTAGHYSMTRVDGDKARVPAKDPSKPTLAELQEQNRFAAQAGTYDVKGDTITLHRIVALSIANMTAGNSATWTFKLDGKTLTLNNTNKDAQGAPLTVKLTRVE